MAKKKLTERKLRFKTQRNLVLPKDPDLNRARRIYNFLLNVEAVLADNPKAIAPERYFRIVKEYHDCCEILVKKGYTIGKNGKAIKGVDIPRVAQDGGQKPASGVGEDRSSSVGAGISTPNPLT